MVKVHLVLLEESIPNLVIPFTKELGEKGVIRAISG